MIGLALRRTTAAMFEVLLIHNVFRLLLVAGVVGTVMEIIIYGSFLTFGVDDPALAQSLLLYVIVSRALANRLNSPADSQLGDSIREGQMAVELSLPGWPLARWAGTYWGRMLLETVVVSVPVIVGATLLLGLRVPSAGEFVRFAVSYGVGVLLVTLIVLASGMLGFILGNTWGVSIARRAVEGVMGGLFIPLTIYPEWLQRLALWTPWPYLHFYPVQAYTGELAPDAWLQAFQILLLWCVLFAGMLAVQWRAWSPKFVSVGG